MSFLFFFTLSFVLISAVLAVHARNLFVSTMWLSVFSLMMASNFFILDAADVAITEAAVGAGVSTVLFLTALALTGELERSGSAARLLPALALFILSMVLFWVSFEHPRLGDPSAPIHNHIAPWYLSETPVLIDIPNVVTAILASFRGFDTLGETIVVFTAGIGVLSVLSFKPKRSASVTAKQVAVKTVRIRDHLILRVVGKLLIPVIMLFALVVQFHGEYSPGGGFSAGALFAAAVMLYGILEGSDRSLSAMPQAIMLRLAATGASIYTLVGIAGLVLGGNFLDYSVLSSDPVSGQQLGILLIEFGVGLTVTSVLVMVFNAFANRESYGE
jgi:multicomponent Na+:H+ antiporter subunit B